MVRRYCVSVGAGQSARVKDSKTVKPTETMKKLKRAMWYAQ